LGGAVDGVNLGGGEAHFLVLKISQQ
jgi:hypothetical protein